MGSEAFEIGWASEKFRRAAIHTEMSSNSLFSSFPSFVPQGHIYLDPNLPSLPPPVRSHVYRSMANCLAALHSSRPSDIGLGQYGDARAYGSRQLRRWGGQYRASRGGCCCNTVVCASMRLQQGGLVGEGRGAGMAGGSGPTCHRHCAVLNALSGSAVGCWGEVVKVMYHAHAHFPCAVLISHCS